MRRSREMKLPPDTASCIFGVVIPDSSSGLYYINYYTFPSTIQRLFQKPTGRESSIVKLFTFRTTAILYSSYIVPCRLANYELSLFTLILALDPADKVEIEGGWTCYFFAVMNFCLTETAVQESNDRFHYCKYNERH